METGLIGETERTGETVKTEEKGRNRLTSRTEGAGGTGERMVAE
jgi:hypothetical protein